MAQTVELGQDEELKRGAPPTNVRLGAEDELRSSIPRACSDLVGLLLLLLLEDVDAIRREDDIYGINIS